MVARADSGIKTLADMKGKKLGFADPDSTSGYLIPVTSLPKEIGAEVKDYFASTGFGGGHEQLVLEVLKGTFDAGTTFGSGVGDFKDGYTSGNLRKMVEKGILKMDDLVELWKSPLIPNGPIVLRTSAVGRRQAEGHRLSDQAAGDRPGLLLGDRGRRLQGLHAGQAGILPADHRRPQGEDRLSQQDRGAAGHHAPAAFSRHVPEASCHERDRHGRPCPRFRRAGAVVERHWQQLASRRRLYTIGGLVLLLLALSGSLWFANETNAGKFFDRLPYVFDFFIDLKPRDWFDPVRALFDLPSPYDDGSLKYDYPDGRVYRRGQLLHPRIFLQDAGDAEHRAVLDADRLHLRLPALLLRGAPT